MILWFFSWTFPWAFVPATIAAPFDESPPPPSPTFVPPCFSVRHTQTPSMVFDARQSLPRRRKHVLFDAPQHAQNARLTPQLAVPRRCPRAAAHIPVRMSSWCVGLVPSSVLLPLHHHTSRRLYRQSSPSATHECSVSPFCPTVSRQITTNVSCDAAPALISLDGTDSREFAIAAACYQASAASPDDALAALA